MAFQLYLVVPTGKLLFGEDGSASEAVNNNWPGLTFGNLENILLQLLNSESVDSATGLYNDKYTGYSAATVSASAVIDTDYNWATDATLHTALSNGVAVSSIVLDYASEETPLRPCGRIWLTDAISVNYNQVTLVSAGVYSFRTADASYETAAYTPTADYAAETAMEVETSCLVETANDDITITKATGLFSIPLDCNNIVLKESIEGESEISSPWLEVQIFVSGVLDKVVSCQVNISNLRKFHAALSNPTSTPLLGELDSRYAQIVPGATEDNFAAFDDAGNLKDSGSKAADFATASHTHTGTYEPANANIQSHISSTSNPHSVTASQAGAVATTGNETIAGTKTFSSFPVTPSSVPTTDYQVANKKYVDDNAGAVSSVFGKTGAVANISDSAGYLYNNGSGVFSYESPAGSGDVTGPSSSTDGNVALFDGATGKIIKDSGAALSSKAASGANSDITSLSGLTTALSIAQGGTAATTAADARTSLGLGTAATGTTGTSNGNIPTRPADNALSADTISEITSTNGVSIDGVRAKDSFIELDEIAAPDSPAADKLRLYAKDSSGTSKLYIKNSAGTETELGSGGGGSGAFADITGEPTDNAALSEYLPDTASSDLVAADHGKPLIASVDAGFGSASLDAIASSIVGAYRFSSGAMTTDSSGNGYTLTNNGSVTSSASGKSDYCADFSGSNYFTMTWASQTHPSFFASMWVYLDRNNTSQALLSLESSDNKYVAHLRVDSSGHLLCEINNTSGTQYTATGSTVINTSGYHHVAAYFDGEYARVYLDGSLEGTSSAFSGSLNTAAKWAIGARAEDAADKLDGRIDELYYWRGASAIFADAAAALTAVQALYNSSDGLYWDAGTVKKYTLGVADNGVCQGRLTLESGVPVSTSDQTAKTTIYFTPYKGNRISIYNGSTWSVRTFSELSLSLSGLASSTNFDVFIYDSSGALTLSATAWTNDTTRATALTLQDGVYVKSGAATYRYLGTFRTTGTTGQTEIVFYSTSQAPQILLWNYYNRAKATIMRHDASDTWSYTTGALRQANGSTANQCNFVIGVNEDDVDATLAALGVGTTAGTGITALIGLDATDTKATNTLASGLTIAAANQQFQLFSTFSGKIGIGYHYLSWLEYGGTGITFYGDAGNTSLYKAGIQVRLNY